MRILKRIISGVLIIITIVIITVVITSAVNDGHIINLDYAYNEDNDHHVYINSGDMIAITWNNGGFYESSIWDFYDYLYDSPYCYDVEVTGETDAEDGITFFVNNQTQSQKTLTWWVYDRELMDYDLYIYIAPMEIPNATTAEWFQYIDGISNVINVTKYGEGTYTNAEISIGDSILFGIYAYDTISYYEGPGGDMNDYFDSKGGIWYNDLYWEKWTLREGLTGQTLHFEIMDDTEMDYHFPIEIIDGDGPGGGTTDPGGTTEPGVNPVPAFMLGVKKVFLMEVGKTKYYEVAYGEVFVLYGDTDDYISRSSTVISMGNITYNGVHYRKYRAMPQGIGWYNCDFVFTKDGVNGQITVKVAGNLGVGGTETQPLPGSDGGSSDNIFYGFIFGAISGITGFLMIILTHSVFGVTPLTLISLVIITSIMVYVVKTALGGGGK